MLAPLCERIRYLCISTPTATTVRSYSFISRTYHLLKPLIGRSIWSSFSGLLSFAKKHGKMLVFLSSRVLWLFLPFISFLFLSLFLDFVATSGWVLNKKYIPGLAVYQMNYNQHVAKRLVGFSIIWYPALIRKHRLALKISSYTIYKHDLQEQFKKTVLWGRGMRRLAKICSSKVDPCRSWVYKPCPPCGQQSCDHLIMF